MKMNILYSFKMTSTHLGILNVGKENNDIGFYF
jgi:hypothetical protein